MDFLSWLLWLDFNPLSGPLGVRPLPSQPEIVLAFVGSEPDPDNPDKFRPHRHIMRGDCPWPMGKEERGRGLLFSIVVSSGEQFSLCTYHTAS